MEFSPMIIQADRPTHERSGLMKIDVRGEICPYPQVKTVAALKKLAPSDQLEVLTDHPPALETVPAQAARLGYVAEIQEVGTAEWCIVLRKG
jgi:tRNA 2-thiouridine synthesizing protein A